MKLKEWIRNKMVSFIMLDKVEEHLIEEIIRLDKNDNTLKSAIESVKSDLSKTNKTISDNGEDINILHNTIKSVVSVGADVYPNEMNRDRSWAVICIEGNYNIVKFIDMHGTDYRYIMNFLKQFEGSRMVVDAPNPKYFESMFKF